MDKKQIIGLILIFALFYGWSLMNTQSKKKVEAEQFVKDSIVQVELAKQDSITKWNAAKVKVAEEAPVVVPDFLTTSQTTEALTRQFGVFAGAADGEASLYMLENEQIKIEFSSLGGAIKNIWVKDYLKVAYDSSKQEVQSALYLMNDDKNEFNYILPVKGVLGNQIQTKDLNFTASQRGNEIIFTAKSSTGGSIQQIYKLGTEGYLLDYDLKLNGLASTIDASAKDFTLQWTNYLDRLELNTNFEKFYSTVYFKESDDDSDYCNCRKDATEEVQNTNIDWVSHANQFFNTSLIAKNQKFTSGVFETQMMEDGSDDLKKLNTTLTLPYHQENEYVMDMEMYLGPNDFEDLRAMGIGLEEIIPFGRSLFGTINRWVIRPAFNFINNYIPSKGITIIILILIIKIILYPLTYKMLHSQAKMGALKPELAGLTEKYKDDAQKKQMETMKIYREYGVSPLGGCMPMVMQMPIWYALFRFFPASIGFRQEGFLWANDLSSYDAFFHLPWDIMGTSHVSLFTILWALTTLIYTYYNSRHMDMSANPAMKYVQYFMPLMFLVFFNNYASGLTAYMFMSNLINIIQTIGTKRFVFNDERIMAELNKNKDKPKKRGKFQSKLEDAMKQQQANQKKKK